MRSEVLAQLAEFQRGYSEREVFIGHAASTQLIRDDWSFRGECTFFLDGVHESSSGDVAWLATIG